MSSARLGPSLATTSTAVLLLALLSCSAPPVPRGTATLDGAPSLRGLHAGPGGVVWASGSAGTVARSLNGGRTWERLTPPPGTEALDFRDVHVFSANEAALLAAGEGEASRLYHTADAGRTWVETWRNRDPNGFLDAMDFWSDGVGLAVGDPIDGRLMILRSDDYGRSWIPLSEPNRPVTLEGEFAFAASGTCIACGPNDRAWIVTGGSAARILRSHDRGASWIPNSVPLITAAASAGAFSVAFADANDGVVVGGDYEQPDSARTTAAWTDDGGRNWTSVEAGSGPSGYRSCVTLLPDGSYLAVGTNGADRSTDGGRTWTRSSMEGWHAASGRAVAGSGGRVGTID